MIAIERWVSELSEATCDRCRRLHGNTYRQGTGPQPPLHDHCRCRRVFDHWQEAPGQGPGRDDDDDGGNGNGKGDGDGDGHGH